MDFELNYNFQSLSEKRERYTVHSLTFFDKIGQSMGILLHGAHLFFVEFIAQDGSEHGYFTAWSSFIVCRIYR